LLEEDLSFLNDRISKYEIFGGVNKHLLFFFFFFLLKKKFLIGGFGNVISFLLVSLSFVLIPLAKPPKKAKKKNILFDFSSFKWNGAKYKKCFRFSKYGKALFRPNFIYRDKLASFQYLSLSYSSFKENFILVNFKNCASEMLKTEEELWKELKVSQ
ncbi:hypothetical protein RFI_19028, partial [Reticulomyxa filosa]